jgi:TatD DNase family protein
MLDSHCHIDRFKDPHGILDDAATQGVFVIAVTNLPSHFQEGLPHVKRYKSARLAVGLHPLSAVQHEQELPLLLESLSQTSFVGEVGLDFSREGEATRDIQVNSFRTLAERLKHTRKVVTLHSRGAETAVLDILTEFQVRHAIFHWYSGALGTLDEVARSGHFFSVNPAMTESQKGRKIIERIPPDQLLTETDGPHVRCSGHPANPWDVAAVEEYVAASWNSTPGQVRTQVWANFQNMLSQIGLLQEANGHHIS